MLFIIVALELLLSANVGSSLVFSANVLIHKRRQNGNKIPHRSVLPEKVLAAKLLSFNMNMLYRCRVNIPCHPLAVPVLSIPVAY